MSAVDRLRNEAHDLLELVLMPGLAALLPWSLCFRVFRWLCKWRFLYREACDEALAHALARGWVKGDPAEWLRERRLVMLIDNADFFLARTRSNRWMGRHLHVRGAWPDPKSGGAILCTFHWGAGMWGLRSAGAHGLHAHPLVAAHRREFFPGRAVRYWYYGLRNRAVADALAQVPIEVSRSPRRIMEALRRGEQVVAAVDVAADQVAASEPIDFIGLRARVPRALLRVAAHERVPVTVFLTGIRMSDGMRTLDIHRLGTRSDAETLIVEVFALLDEAVRRDPAAWHFWQIAPRFFESAPGVPPG